MNCYLQKPTKQVVIIIFTPYFHFADLNFCDQLITRVNLNICTVHLNSPGSRMPQEPKIYTVDLTRLPDFENSALISPPKIEIELMFTSVCVI